MTPDIFISFTREDEKLAARLAKALEAEGFAVWWDRSLCPTESSREEIQTALDAAKITIVVWTKRSTGPQGAFVRDEASQAKERGCLVPVMMEKTRRLPLDFGELPAIDLVGWRGGRKNIFFRDLVAVVQAKLAETPPPKPRGPLQRTLRRATAGVSAVGLGGALAFASNFLSVQQQVCSIGIAQPQISDVCGALRLGGKPTRDERLAWSAVPAGNCDALRAHIEQYPDGAFRTAAADMIAARRVAQEEVWTPDDRMLRLFVSTDAALSGSEALARSDAESRAHQEAQHLCGGFANTQTYRLTLSAPRIESWDCEAYAGGHICSGRGEALCAVEVLGIVENETCGDQQ